MSFHNLTNPDHVALLQELIDQGRSHFLSGGHDVTEQQVMRAQCHEYTRAFVKRFPDLTVVRGFYSTAECPEDDAGFVDGAEHRWCETPDGQIVDPTWGQFQRGNGKYIKFDPARHMIRVGCCVNCGDDIHGLEADGEKCICSDECEQSYARYLERESRRA